MAEQLPTIALESLPDLATPVGLGGQMQHIEVGGEICFSVVIAIACDDGRA